MSHQKKFELNPALDFIDSEDLGIVLSFEFKILAINDVALRFYKWEREGVLGEDYRDLCEKQGLRVPVLEARDAVLSGKEVRDKTYTIVQKKDENKYQSEITFFYRFRPYYGIGGRIDGILVLGNTNHLDREVPETRVVDGFTKKILADLEAVEALFFADEDGKIRYCSGVFAQHFGMVSSDILGKTFLELRDSFEFQNLHNQLKRLLQEGGKTSVQLCYSGRIYRFDLLCCLGVGDKKWIWGRMKSANRLHEN